MASSQGVTLVTLMPLGWQRLYKYLSLRWVLGQPTFYNSLRRIKGREQRSSGPGAMLEALNFIHFGRWVVLNQHPYRGHRAQGLPRFRSAGQPPETIPYGLMLFTSNFDDDWEPYVDIFMEAAVDELGAFWDNMPDWQRPSAGFEDFFEFVNRHTVPHGHYYSAFKNLATADIKAALFVDRHVRSFLNRTAGMSDPAWDLAYRRLITKLQRSLGTIADSPGIPTKRATWSTSGQHLSLTSLAPLPRDRIELVQGAIASMNAKPSPFGDIHGTHFARLSIIESVTNGDDKVPLASAYVLLSADADGRDASMLGWVGRLHQALSNTPHPSLIDAIWGECYGFPPGATQEEFEQYIEATSFAPTVPFADYPRISLWDIERARLTHAAFTNGVVFRPLSPGVTRRDLFEDFAHYLPPLAPPGGDWEPNPLLGATNRAPCSSGANP